MSDLLGVPATEADLFSMKAKLDVAKASLVALSACLRPGDRFALVTFEETAKVVVPLTVIETGEESGVASPATIERVNEAIRGVSCGGGTSLMAGMTMATNTLTDGTSGRGSGDVAVSEGPRERRIVFVTDMNDTAEDESGIGAVAAACARNAADGINASFIGVGSDLVAESAEAVSSVPGANYMCVHTEEQFVRLLSNEFRYLFFPAAFRVSVDVASDDWDVAAAFGGSRQATAGVDEKPEGGCVFAVDTMFPSAMVAPLKGNKGTERAEGVAADDPDARDTVGGLILLRLAPHAGDGDIHGGTTGTDATTMTVKLTYVDATLGRPDDEPTHTVTKTLTIPRLVAGGSDKTAAESDTGESFSNDAIRKGVVAHQYVSTARRFLTAMADARAPAAEVAAAKAQLRSFAPRLTAEAEVVRDAGLQQDARMVNEWVAVHCRAS